VKLSQPQIIELLRQKADRYNSAEFIETDPIQIPHGYSKKEDIEIAGFITAVIAWGRRDTIIKNATRFFEWMDHSPHEFILNFQESDLKPFTQFVHRTFNGDDSLVFLHALRRLYEEHEGLEEVLAQSFRKNVEQEGLGWHSFKAVFFEETELPRSFKHLPDPLKGSAAKRMNMFLRWMVRSDDRGVDFGIWNKIAPSQLYIPLDVHTSRVARKLGILNRKQDDWKAVLELNQFLQKIDSEDPVRFDFALFGLGAFENF
jgi:uncharacterized protein (TIGR02757 family)